MQYGFKRWNSNEMISDVAFDILSKRVPHFQHAVRLLELAAEDKTALLIAERSLANLICLSFEIYKLKNSEQRLPDFIAACEIISGGKEIMIRAVSPFKDKEDALQYYTALNHGADYFITRSISDYKKGSQRLPVLTPKEFFDSICGLPKRVQNLAQDNRLQCIEGFRNRNRLFYYSF